MLLDDFIPQAEFVEVHETSVAASPERALAAAKAVEPRELPLTRALFAVRLLPAALARREEALSRARTSLYEQLLGEGFLELAEEPGREVVVGVVGRFWSLRHGSPIRLDGPRDFLEFDEPGYAKAVFSFAAEPDDRGARLRTETRVVTTDAASRRAFARYWRVVRPGSGLIRREWLRAAKRRAERT